MELRPHPAELELGMQPGVPLCTETMENQKSRLGGDAPCKDTSTGERFLFCAAPQAPS